MKTIHYTFKSYERLKRKKLIAQLFGGSRAIGSVYPFRLLYMLCPDPALTSHQVLFSVPKKKVQKATDRNLIRRRMREAYRLHKHILPTPQGSSPRLLIGYIYVGNKTSIDYTILCDKIVEGLEALKIICQPVKNKERAK